MLSASTWLHRLRHLPPATCHLALLLCLQSCDAPFRQRPIPVSLHCCTTLCHFSSNRRFVAPQQATAIVATIAVAVAVIAVATIYTDFFSGCCYLCRSSPLCIYFCSGIGGFVHKCHTTFGLVSVALSVGGKLIVRITAYGSYLNAR